MSIQKEIEKFHTKKVKPILTGSATKINITNNFD